MTALLMAETNRYLSRRMTRWVPFGVLALTAIGFTIAYFVIRAEGGSIDFVRDMAFQADEDFGLATEQPESRTFILGPIGFLFPIIAFAMGASFFGADQKNGVIELLLTWQPKRLRLLLARALGGFVVTALMAVLLSVAFIAAQYILAGLVGTTEGMTSQMWGWLGAAVLRSGVAAGVFFLIGLGITVVVNNSIAAIVGFVIYVFVVENLLSAFVELVGPWLPMVNTTAFSFGSNVAPATVFSDFSEGFPPVHHGPMVAGLIMAAYAVVFLVVGFVVFKRRDVA